MRKSLLSFVAAAVAALTFTAQAGLDTVTYVSHDGGGSGAVEGDISGQSPVTLLDSKGGDMWNGGDQFIYLHQGAKVTGSFSATARILSQTEEVDGRWGKTGIRASDSLDGDSPNAMAQFATGNGSQTGGITPIPARLGGRTGPALSTGFEDNIPGSPTDFFAAGSTEPFWARLDYDAGTNGFTAAYATDNAGTPGAWQFSPERTDITGGADGWYVGLAYSAHFDLNFDQVTRADNLHGVTFDNFSIVLDSAAVPEPSFTLGLIGLLSGWMVSRRRRR